MDTYKEIQEHFSFPQLSKKQDEDEHSLEMHFPWIAETFGLNIKVVPLVVGGLTDEFTKKFGTFFKRYIKDDETCFIISSDFCHWGERFDYTYYDQSKGEIYKSIESLDKQGMSMISSLKSKNFKDYLDKYKNTICGRNPILLLMNVRINLLNYRLWKNPGLNSI